LQLLLMPLTILPCCLLLLLLLLLLHLPPLLLLQLQLPLLLLGFAQPKQALACGTPITRTAT
jgi:hypothetical protein